jgi:hypothetical protein
MPKRMIFDEQGKPSNMIFDENGHPKPPIQMEESYFLVSYISFFNIDAKSLCETFGIAYSTFKRWKGESKINLKPIDLLKRSGAGSLADAVIDFPFLMYLWIRLNGCISQ